MNFNIGEALLDCVIGVIALIIEIILAIIAFVLDIVINTFSFVFQNDFVHKLYVAMPFLNQVDSIFTTIGVGIAVILLLFMIYQMAMGPLLSNKTQPRAYVGLVLVRTFLVIPLVICANSISIWLANFFTTMYSAVYSAYSSTLDSYTGNGNPFYLTSTIGKFVVGDGASSISNPITTVEGIDNIKSGLGLTDGAMEVITTLTSTIIILVLVILVGWNLIQFFLEVFERFAVMFFIMKVSPLCIATAINPSTQNIATSWLKFFIGQFTLWIMQIMCMGWVTSCLGSLQDFTAAFTNDAMGGLMAWAGICYGLINMSRHVDDYINKLGLTAATTGSDFFRDINAIASAIRAGEAIGGATAKTAKKYVKSVNKGTDAAGLPGTSAANHFFKNEKMETDGTDSISGTPSTEGKQAVSMSMKPSESGVSAKESGSNTLQTAESNNAKVDMAKDTDKVTLGQVAKATAVTSAFIVGGMIAGPAGVAGAALATSAVSSANQFFKQKRSIQHSNNASQASNNIKSRIQSTHNLPGTSASRANFDTSISLPDVSSDGSSMTDGSYNSVATSTSNTGVVTEAEMTSGRIIPNESTPKDFETATITQDERHTYKQDVGATEEEAKYTVDNKSFVTKNASDDTGEAYETYSLDKENNETLKFVQRGHYENGAAGASFDAAKRIVRDEKYSRQPRNKHIHAKTSGTTEAQSGRSKNTDSGNK